MRWFLLAGLLAFILFSFLTWSAPAGIYNSPDETANVFFAKSVAKETSLRVPEPLNRLAAGQLHPRSVTAVGDFLVPVSFVGLPVIYGTIMLYLGVGVLPWLTPLFTVLAGYAWYGILKSRLLSPRGAKIATILFWTSPPVLYWANRGLMHMMLFVDLLLFGAWFLIAKPLQRKGMPHFLNDVAGTLFVGLALLTRASEVFWVAPLWLLLMYFEHRRNKKILLLSLGILAMFAIALLVANRTLYSAPFHFGYQIDRGRAPFLELLFPYGFHPKTAFVNLGIYFFGYFPWVTLPMLLAIAYLLRERRRSEGAAQRLAPAGAHRVFPWFFRICFFLLVWLGITYGSGTYHDNPTTLAPTLGDSYLRYWLPLFVLGTVFGALFLRQFRPRRWGIPMLIIIVAASLIKVFTEPGDGLLDVRRELIRYTRIQSEVISMTPPEAVIITDRADKIFFPKRRVMRVLDAPATKQAMRALKGTVPLYLYHATFSPHLLSYMKARLFEDGFLLRPVASFEGETLYSLQ